MRLGGRLVDEPGNASSSGLAEGGRFCFTGPVQVVMQSRFAVERRLLAEGFRCVAGIDEAGRGPLAGPVVAAAVILPVDWVARGMPADLEGLNDSKQLQPGRRERYFGILMGHPEVRHGIAVVEADEIDRLNILRATHVGMLRALAQLPGVPDHTLVDGLRVPTIAGAQTALVKGDSLSYSIAAASVLAKVTRDRLMVAWDRQWPAYGFAVHKGYPTPAHKAALSAHGPCPIHRRSFAPVLAAATQQDLFQG